ncbi:FadR family transcriptional regulator|uniref:FadR/GntR family transcriptional regulator n=1 Tax=Pseudomonas sp. SbOxS1 TaxID=2723884 RepID=UPI0015D2127B|nr:FadR/GntR family transcriptional regulator [Pseudomonas sp. SbOxS1]NYU05095.1 FadR family transcriptional regulator [Pseudomonas sp. SbOxS1]
MVSAAPDRRLNLAQQLVLDLSRKILAGELPAGTKLPTEQVITQERGVSRTVVREALSRLQAEGLVETRRGIGTFVVDTIRPGDFQGNQHEKGSAYDAVAIIELRLSLEVEAAAIAAQCATPSQLLAMRYVLDEAHALDPASEQSTRLDFEFHLQIAQCTANGFFIDAMTHLGSMLLSATQQPTPAVTEQLRSLQVREREQIYAAVARQDVEAARAAMRLHLTNGLHRARSVVQSAAR